MPTVYLAGPIVGQTYASATEWRKVTAKKLTSFGIRSISPMRDKEHLAKMDTLSGPGESYDDVLSCDRGIMRRDHFDVCSADLIIANLLGLTRPALGTAMEIAWAYHAHKPVILVIEPKGNPSDHPMIREAVSFRVTTLDEAVNVARSVLSPYADG